MGTHAASRPHLPQTVQPSCVPYASLGRYGWYPTSCTSSYDYICEVPFTALQCPSSPPPAAVLALPTTLCKCGTEGCTAMHHNHGFEVAASMCCTADRSHSYQQSHRGMRVMSCSMKALSCPTCCQACLPRRTSRTALRTAPAATSCSTQRKIGRTLLLCASQSSGTARWSTGTRQTSSFLSNRGAAAVHVVSAGAAMVVGNMTG